MTTSTEHISQCNQSEPLADASGRIVDLMYENAHNPVRDQLCRPFITVSKPAHATDHNRQGYILTNLINMSVKLFSTVSIVFFPVDFKSDRYHSRFCIFN